MLRGGVLNSDSVVINGGDIFNDGTINTKTMDITFNHIPNDRLSGVINASESIVYKGRPTNQLEFPVKAILSTPLLKIENTAFSVETGLLIESSEVLKNVKQIKIVSGGTRTGLVFRSKDPITVLAPIELTGGDARIEASYGTTLNLDKVYSTYTGAGKNKPLIQGTTNDQNQVTTISIKELAANENGYFCLTSWSAPENKGEVIYNLDTINLENNSKLEVKSGGTHNLPPITINGKGENQALTINITGSAVADFAGIKISEEDLAADPNPSNVAVNADQLLVNISSSDPSASKVYLPGQTDLSKTKIVVKADGTSATGKAEEDLTKLSSVVQIVSKSDDKTHLIQNGLNGVELVQLPGDITDGAKGTSNADGTVSDVAVDVNPNKPTTPDTPDTPDTSSDIVIIGNPVVKGVAEMSALNYMIWRNEINDMTKRLGDVRDNLDLSNGLWAKVYNGRSKYGSLSVKNKYTGLQFGADRKFDVTDSSKLIVGAAFSYTDGNNSFNLGSGDNKLYSFNIYGSMIWDNGIYVDVTGKYGRLHNDFKINNYGDLTKTSYHNNAFSLSAEAGWRIFPINNIVYVEPQAELMFGRVNGASFRTSSDVSVHQDAISSVIGRAGVAFGAKCPSGRGGAFIKASVLHDWKGDAKYSFNKGTTRHEKLSLGDTWAEFKVGGNVNFGKNLQAFGEVETDAGGKVRTEYRVQLGVRYSF